ncbi:unnamed protein product, partial [Caretta caretta]
YSERLDERSVLSVVHGKVLSGYPEQSEWKGSTWNGSIREEPGETGIHFYVCLEKEPRLRILDTKSVSIDESWMVSSVPAILIGRVFHISQQQIEQQQLFCDLQSLHVFEEYNHSSEIVSAVIHSRGTCVDNRNLAQFWTMLNGLCCRCQY